MSFKTPPIKFYGSQVGGKTVTPHSYTESPIVLLRHDIWSAIGGVPFFQYIVRPLRPWRSGSLCELYPSWANIWSLFLHFVLIVMQLALLLSIPFWFIFFIPLTTILSGAAVFGVVNQSICFILNGPKTEYVSDPRYAKVTKEHEHEQWIFLNGVAVGRHWMESNLNRLALTFGRPILGVHNRTNGIIFDVIECLIQRNFNYATQDIRDCYKTVKEKLYNEQYTKIVFILHSQGGIEGGMIIDWLLQEVPQDLLAKLEVYTFGNAANHFNNPHAHLLSQHAAVSHPKSMRSTRTTTQVHYHDAIPANGNGDSRRDTTKSSQRSLGGKTIRYIEHYANTSDFVARWGVLHYLCNSSPAPTAPRYMGRAFERLGEGHQFNQHYLDSMFPLQPSTAGGGGIGNSGFEGAAEECEFMESVVQWGRTGDSPGHEREGLAMSYLAAQGEPLRAGDEETVVMDMSPVSPKATVSALKADFDNGRGFTDTRLAREADGFEFKVKDLSRLWGYRNGRSPRIDEVDVGIARMATI